MSHYTINSLSRPDLQSLARKANHERSASLKHALAWVAARIRETAQGNTTSGNVKDPI